MLIPASTPKDLLEDPQLEARDYWEKVDYPEWGATLTYPGALYKSSEIDWEFRRAPSIGEHNGEVYEQEFGFTKERLSALRKAGII